MCGILQYYRQDRVVFNPCARIFGTLYENTQQCSPPCTRPFSYMYTSFCRYCLAFALSRWLEVVPGASNRPGIEARLKAPLAVIPRCRSR